MAVFEKENHSLDLLIVGAGLAGIGLAHHLRRELPDWRWEIHEEKADLGGTWQVFRYPGIRSDSDMANYAYPFEPWRDDRALLDGASIVDYMRGVAEKDGTVERIRFGHRVEEAEWHSDEGLWEVRIRTAEGERITRWAKRVHWASGYFDHERGHQPDFPGQEEFRGRIIHPQLWPGDEDLDGRRVVVIGSGATAITLIPSLVERGADVVMLQRTPGWIAPLPNKDLIGKTWRTVLPFAPKAAAAGTHVCHSLRDTGQVAIAKAAPRVFGGALHLMQRRFIDGEEIKRNFTPDYDPWTQRVCKCPDGDFFQVIGRGARVVTDRVEEFTAEGVRTARHGVLEADIIVPATGLELKMLGGARLLIDGEEAPIPGRLSYRGVMLDGVPNTSFSVGYFNASWTLRVDLVNRWLTRLWREHPGLIVPKAPAGTARRDFIELDSGYIRRGVHRMPRQGDTLAWSFTQNYVVEKAGFTGPGRYRDLRFGRGARSAVSAATGEGAVRTVPSRGRYPAVSTAGLPEPRGVRLGAGRIRARVAGDPGAGEPTVFLHGLIRSLEDFDEQLVLAAAGEGAGGAAIALELPGFGGSELLRPVTIGDTADVLWRALDELGVSRAHLVGNSLGGALAWEMAARQPERVSSLGLVDSLGFGHRVIALLCPLSLPGVARISGAAIRNATVLKLLERVLLRRPGAVTPHRLEVQRANARNPRRAEAFIGHLRSLGWTGRGYRRWRADVAKRWARATREQAIPVFIAWGGRDPLMPRGDFRAAVGELHPARAVLFPRCGHIPQVEEPSAFAREYRAFREECAGE